MLRFDKNRKNTSDSENGMIVVEAVITLTIFIMTVALIVYLVTIFTVHNKIQFALNSAAHEVATYSYLYQATGLRSADQQVREDGSQDVGNINDTAAKVLDTVGKIEELAGQASNVGNSLSNPEMSSDYLNSTYQQLSGLESSVNSTVDSAQQSVDAVENLISDPKGLAAGIIYMAFEEGESYLKGLIGAGIAKYMTEGYLESPGMSADDYCIAHGIVGGYEGLDFTGSSVFRDGTQGWNPTDGKAKGDYRMIDFVVTYKIDLGFARLVLPPDQAYLTVVQRVSVPAWTNGDGREPEDYGVTFLGNPPKNNSGDGSGGETEGNSQNE